MLVFITGIYQEGRKSIKIVHSVPGMATNSQALLHLEELSVPSYLTNVQQRQVRLGTGTLCCYTGAVSRGSRERTAPYCIYFLVLLVITRFCNKPQVLFSPESLKVTCPFTDDTSQQYAGRATLRCALTDSPQVGLRYMDPTCHT